MGCITVVEYSSMPAEIQPAGVISIYSTTKEIIKSTNLAAEARTITVNSCSPLVEALYESECGLYVLCG